MPVTGRLYNGENGNSSFILPNQYGSFDKRK
jgi:hypothetical protein